MAYSKVDEKSELILIMTTVLVYGNFINVHVGHFRLFEFAKSLGNNLVVGIHEQESSNLHFSKTILEAIPFINLTRSFSSLNDLLEDVKPDIVVRGFEHKDDKDSDNLLIQSKGIKLFFGAGHSSVTQSDYDNEWSNNIPIRNSFRSYVSTQNITESQIIEVLKRISKTRVRVVGDLIVDEYVNCKPLGISQEDPFLVFSPTYSRRFLGGAAVVASHCKSLGAQVELITTIGEDEVGQWANSELEKLEIDTKIVVNPYRPTVLKQRFKSGNQTVFRLSHLRSDVSQANLESQIILHALKSLDDIQALIFSDFAYGCLTKEVASKILEGIRNFRHLHSIADSQTSSQVGSLVKFKGVKIISATEHEARHELRNESDGVAVITERIANYLEVDRVILKLGADGLLFRDVFDDGSPKPPQMVPSINVSPIDPSGAGDALLAMTSLSLSAGANLRIATLLGSLTAGIQVSRRGNIPITFDEISKVLSSIYQY